MIMNFSVTDIKTILFAGQVLSGIVLMGIGWFVWQQANRAQEPISYWLTAIILAVVGIVLIIFGAETYLRHDDPDVGS